MILHSRWAAVYYRLCDTREDIRLTQRCFIASVAEAWRVSCSRLTRVASRSLPRICPCPCPDVELRQTRSCWREYRCQRGQVVSKRLRYVFYDGYSPCRCSSVVLRSRRSSENKDNRRDDGYDKHVAWIPLPMNFQTASDRYLKDRSAPRTT